MEGSALLALTEPLNHEWTPMHTNKEGLTVKGGLSKQVKASMGRKSLLFAFIRVHSWFHLLFLGSRFEPGGHYLTGRPTMMPAWPENRAR